MDDSNVIKLNDPVMYLKMAVKSLNNFEYENAIKRCLRAVDLSFNFGYKGVDSSLLGLIYLRSGNYREALTCFYRALAYGNKQSFLKVHLMIIQAFISEEKIKCADEYIKFLIDVKLIDEETKDIIVSNYNAIIEDAKKEKIESDTCVNKLIKDAIKNVNNKNFDEASKILVKAKAILPNNYLVDYLYENIDEAFSGEINFSSKLPANVIVTKQNYLENICQGREDVASFVESSSFGANMQFAMDYANKNTIDKLFDCIFEYGVNNRVSYILEDLLFSDFNDEYKLLLLRKFVERKYIQKHCIRCKNRLNIIYPIYFNGNERLYFEPVLNAIEYLTKNKKVLNIDLLYVLNYLDAYMNSDNIVYLEDKDTCERIIVYKYLSDMGVRVSQSYITESLKEGIKAFKIEMKKETKKLNPSLLPENVVLFPTVK